MHKLTQYITAYHSCFTESKNTVLQVNYLSVCLVFLSSVHHLHVTGLKKKKKVDYRMKTATDLILEHEVVSINFSIF